MSFVHFLKVALIISLVRRSPPAARRFRNSNKPEVVRTQCIAFLTQAQTVVSFISAEWKPYSCENGLHRQETAERFRRVVRAPDSSRDQSRRTIEAASRVHEERSVSAAPKSGCL